MASLRTNAAFMDYLEQCATEGAVYGDVFFHVSADDWNRYHRIIGVKTKGQAERTILLSTRQVLARIADWRDRTTESVARTLTS